jgi:galactokinase
MSNAEIPARFHSFVTNDALVVRSPGRINLIGEHTDYNDGFVLPAAIDKAVYVSVEKHDSNRVKLFSVDFNESIEVRIDEIKPIKGHWATYILGVVDQLLKRGHPVTGFEMSIYGDVPLGAGLSSSAAIECAAAFALNELFGFGIERMELARISQLAEHTYAGVMCGIMDQFASLFGKKDHVIKLDCRSMEYQYIPFNPADFKIVLFDSKVKHSLASTEYNIRRQECEEGVSVIKTKYPEVESLRDVNMDMINKCLDVSGKIYHRCKYVVQENERLVIGCDDLTKGDLEAFGKKMFATHEGLSREYEVSCSELDALIESVKQLPGVIGARMMGGGFGGCTVNLVKKDQVDNVIEKVFSNYKSLTGKDTAYYMVETGNGSSIITQQ